MMKLSQRGHLVDFIVRASLFRMVDVVNTNTHSYRSALSTSYKEIYILSCGLDFDFADNKRDRNLEKLHKYFIPTMIEMTVQKEVD